MNNRRRLLASSKSPRELVDIGAITPLSFYGYGIGAGSVGDYALFAGGATGYDLSTSSYNSSAVVNAYDTSLTRSILSDLSRPMCYLSGASVGDYVIFGGDPDSIVANAFNSSLTKVSSIFYLSNLGQNITASIGDYAIFTGGSSSGNPTGTVDAYDTLLTRTTPTALSVARRNLAATSVGNYALFGGGGSVVDAYNTSLTRSTPTPLSVARYDLAATSVSDYALFGGGRVSGGYRDTVDAYDISLTRSTPTPLSVARDGLTGVSTKILDYALFAGGWASYAIAAIDVYSEALTRSTIAPLLQNTKYNSAAPVGDYVLFTGGGSHNGTVEAYQAI